MTSLPSEPPFKCRRCCLFFSSKAEVKRHGGRKKCVDVRKQEALGEILGMSLL